MVTVKRGTVDSVPNERAGGRDTNPVARSFGWISADCEKGVAKL
jgi:hypothetical protein